MFNGTQLLALIPEKHKRDALEVCKKIFQEKGKDCLMWYVEYTVKMNKKKPVDSFGAYLSSICWRVIL